MPRLSYALGDRSFRKAPVREQQGPIMVGGRIPVVRFPGWMYCPKCRKMYGYPRSDGRASDPILCSEEACRKAESVLASMPWMLICRNGHMDDLPWPFLVHREAKAQNQRTCQDRTLLFFRPADRNNLRSRIACKACGSQLDLQGLRAKGFLKGISCRGKQPWMPEEEECGVRADSGSLVAVGLGDHFAHYPVVISALDIPPESRLDPRNDIGKRLREHADWRRLKDIYLQHSAEVTTQVDF